MEVKVAEQSSVAMHHRNGGIQWKLTEKKMVLTSDNVVTDDFFNCNKETAIIVIKGSCVIKSRNNVSINAVHKHFNGIISFYLVEQ